MRLCSSPQQGYPPAKQAEWMPQPGRWYWSDSALLGITTIKLIAFLFLCFKGRENALLMKILYVWVFLRCQYPQLQ